MRRPRLNSLHSRMSEHKATVTWKRASHGFTYEEYNREHQWAFDGGAKVLASAAPAFKGKPEAVDPEEAMVAALSGCHMLTFLAMASKKKLVVDSYSDEAIGWLDKNAEGKLALTKVVLKPKVTFSEAGLGSGVSDADLKALHQAAHDNCFIANSVKTQVTVEG